MSLDLEARLKAFFASAPQRIHPVQTLAFSHSAMSGTRYLWRETTAQSVKLETGILVQMHPCNFEIKLAGEQGHLDQLFEINLDLTDGYNDFRDELDRVPVDTLEKVQVMYREYLSDDLESPLAVAQLQVETISYRKGAASIVAASPRLNMTRTGDLYVPRDIPMLRGFV